MDIGSQALTPTLELGASPWQKLIYGAAILMALYFYGLRAIEFTFISLPQSSLSRIGASVVLAVGVFWCIWQGARRMWLETGLYLRVDEVGVTVHTRQKRVSLPWEEIYAFTAAEKSEDGKVGLWLTLRGHDNRILAQWDRNWCQFTRGQKRLSDEIEKRIHYVLREMGREKKDSRVHLNAWQERYPLSNSNQFVEVNVGMPIVGWLGIVFFTPCAYFAWIAPPSRGGPPVGVVFLLFAVLSLCLVVSDAKLRISEQSIEMSSLFSRHRISWDEVQNVQIDERGQCVVFRGSTKTLATSGPVIWRGSKAELLLLIRSQCEKRELPCDDQASVSWATSKNTKVKHSS